MTIHPHLKHIHPRINDLIPYQPGKTVSEIQRTYGLNSVVKLASNENPLGCSPKAQLAAQNACHDLASYPEDEAPKLKQTLAELLSIETNQLTLGAGSSEIFDILLQVVMSHGGNMIVSQHAFFLYKVLANSLGIDVKTAPDQNFQQDLDCILNTIDSSTRLIILANPNNPTGTWVSYEKLSAFIANVPEHITIVIDEAYHEYMQIFPDYGSVVPLIAKHPNLVVTRTFSKVYGLAGLRIGYGVTSAEMTNLLNRVRKAFNVSSLTLATAHAALLDQDFVQQSITVNQQGLQQLSQAFTSMNLPMIESAANFITIEVGEQALTLAQQLLGQGVIVRPLLPNQMLNHLRVSVGTTEQNNLFLEKFNHLYKPS